MSEIRILNNTGALLESLAAGYMTVSAFYQKPGTTYQELSDRFYEIQKEVQIQDSMMRIKLRNLKSELDSVTKNLNNLKIN